MSASRDIAIAGAKPFIERARHNQWPRIEAEEHTAVRRVLDRAILSGSSAPESVALENEFAEWIGAKYCLLTHSGTSALHIALAASGVRAGDHVIVPAYSFVATAHAVLHCGAIPIFVDTDRTTGLIDIAKVKSAITSRTRAILPVHVHGCPADLDPLMAIAEEHKLVVVEDAAQAHGAAYGGRHAGAIGRAGAFSLQSSKNFGVGEGGLFVTSDRAVAEHANRLRNFGQDVLLEDRAGVDVGRPLDGSRSLDAIELGWMYRGTEMMAALARAQLKKLPSRTSNCQRNAQRLSDALSALPGVSAPHVPDGRTSVHHKFRVRLDPKAAGIALSPRQFRDVVMRALRAEGLEVVLWQTDVLPAQGAFQRRDGFGGGWPWTTDRESDFNALYNPASFPNARALLEESLVLFSQSCPLIAQSKELVDDYAKAFARVWQQRDFLKDLALSQ